MKTTKYSWAIFILAIIVMGSCRKKHEPMPSGDSGKNTTGQMNKLGKKLENPYTVANMRIAYKNLKARNSSVRVSSSRDSFEEVEIEVTHLYIKFKPKDELELGLLKQDSTLILYNYPLDYEIEEGAGYYRDPSVPEGTPTYQYCAVRVSKSLPTEVEYEVLAELYIPDEYKDAPSSNQRKALSETFVNALVSEAFHIVGGDSTKTTYSNKSISAKQGKWRPAGRVAVWDDAINDWRGVQGVVVKARRWFTTHPGTADVNGYYSCDGTFKNDANYSLDWERHDFALREGWLDGANINGPNQEGDWNVYLNGRADRSAFHAKVFMAAFHYYYKDIKGLRRPPQNGTFKTQLHIRCHNESDPETNGFHSPGRRFLGLGSAVHINNQQKDDPRLLVLINTIYGTTIHELAHASHWNMSSGRDYAECDDIVLESWARGVQYELTRLVWTAYLPRYGRRKAGDAEDKPKWYNYTGMVPDLIDNDFSNSDLVNGYSIRQIEDALLGQRTWIDWRNNIQNKYNNATENHLETLFNYWN